MSVAWNGLRWSAQKDPPVKIDLMRLVALFSLCLTTGGPALADEFGLNEADSNGERGRGYLPARGHDENIPDKRERHRGSVCALDLPGQINARGLGTDHYG